MIYESVVSNVRSTLMGVALAIAVLAGTADAAEQVAWNQVAFKSAQNAGKSITVEIAASLSVLKMQFGLTPWKIRLAWTATPLRRIINDWSSLLADQPTGKDAHP